MFCLEPSEVEELACAMGMKKNALIGVIKGIFEGIAKKIPNRVGASMNPCWTPLLIHKDSEVALSKLTTPDMSLWKDSTILRSLGGHPTICSKIKQEEKEEDL